MPTQKKPDLDQVSFLVGVDWREGPPVPIPNTEVKPFSADGTWLETTWESRTLPDSTKKSLRRCLGLFLCVSGEILLPAHLRRSQRTYLVRFIPVRRLWWKQHGDEHLGEQEAERRSNFVHLKKSYFQIIPTNVRHCTWLRFFLPPAVRNFRQEKSHGRVGERKRKKRFSFRLQRPKAPVIFDEVRERTWLDSSLRQKALL